MESTITTADLAEHLAEILDRVRYRGERFAIVCDGERIATLAPAGAPSGITMREVLAHRGADFALLDEDFATDLEQIQRAQPTLRPPPWPGDL
ncbi:MAG TPA: hypothetical protein VFW96_16120 [Thermomicrobiales bacterium]|nr:hypothetical protein [Thermomicrobiales bacterium]